MSLDSIAGIDLIVLVLRLVLRLKLELDDSVDINTTMNWNIAAVLDIVLVMVMDENLVVNLGITAVIDFGGMVRIRG